MKILVTGGAGFIGSALIRYVIDNTSDEIVNVDKLTYAGNLRNLESVCENERYAFEQVDICDQRRLREVFKVHKPDAVINIAAESHVDRAIDAPADFIRTNVVGTYTLLDVAKEYWLQLPKSGADNFRFFQVSTDEVYGSLESGSSPARESSACVPSSPYSASKAGADHLVQAWHKTYGLPVVISRSTNNYGPCQYPEKLIPLMISKAVKGEALPVYGHGRQIRDWIYVDDHVEAVYQLLIKGKVGEIYNIGANNQRQNIAVVNRICEILSELMGPDDSPVGGGLADVASINASIEFVTDRPGHDLQYSISVQKIVDELDWSPREDFDSGLRKTISWYLANGGIFYPEVFACKTKI